MIDNPNNMIGFLTTVEEAELNKQFVKDNFCPFDEDPFAYDYEGKNLFDESVY